MNRISGMTHGQIITLWCAGKSAAWIAEQLEINRETVGGASSERGIKATSRSATVMRSKTDIHGTVKRQVREMFETDEKKALQPLPAENFPVLSIVSLLSLRSQAHGLVLFRLSF